MSLNKDQNIQFDLFAQSTKNIDQIIHSGFRNYSPLSHQAVIRLFHAAPNASNVDVYVNEYRFLTNLSYKEISHSLCLPSGKYQIDIYPTGNQVSTILSKKIIVQPGSLFTFVLTGDVEKLYLLSVPYQPSLPLGEAKIRFIQLVKDAPSIDFAATYGDTVFPNVKYKQVTDYLGITPMTVDLETRPAGTKDIFLAMKKMKFKPNRAYTIALIGSSSEEAPIQAIILKDDYPKLT